MNISKFRNIFKKKKYFNAFKVNNVMLLPKMEKIVINTSLGILGENKKFIKSVFEQLKLITNQKPLIIKAKKSISNFKIKKKANIALKVTLRGSNMYKFIYKFIHVTCKRIRDFKGFNNKSFDSFGNFNLGIKEQSVFSEIKSFESLKNNFGMNISIVIRSNNVFLSKKMLRFIKFPIL